MSEIDADKIISILKQEARSLEQYLDRHMASIEKALQFQKMIADIELHKALPGVKGKLERLMDSFVALSRGDVIMDWRAEVYQHDQELLQSLTAGEEFRAVVPPLDDDSFDDADFTEFIDAQVNAARRGVEIHRVYLFDTKNHRDTRLAGNPLQEHLRQLAVHSKRIKLYTAVSRKALSDFVLFGKSRCSVSRGRIDATNYQIFPVTYTSNPKTLSLCESHWANLDKQLVFPA